jgi:hypothetical protein
MSLHEIGFESHDNGYVKFTRVRLPLNHMLMRNAVVTPAGEFKRVGSELAMYACMLILRASLCSYGTMICAASCTVYLNKHL